MRHIENEIDKLVYDEYGDKLDEKDKEIEKKDNELKTKDKEIKTKDKKVDELNQTNEEYKNKLKELNKTTNLPPEAKKNNQLNDVALKKSFQMTTQSSDLII